MPYIVMAISQPNDVSTCRCAINCFSDVLLTIGSCEGTMEQQQCQAQIQQVHNVLIKSVVESLKSANTPSDILPDLFTCLSCFYWEMKELIMPFTQQILEISYVATQTTDVETTYQEDLEWYERLFCSVVELWDSISNVIQTLGLTANSLLQGALDLVRRVMVSKFDSPQLEKAMILMLRDLAYEMGEQAAKMVGCGGRE